MFKLIIQVASTITTAYLQLITQLQSWVNTICRKIRKSVNWKALPFDWLTGEQKIFVNYYDYAALILPWIRALEQEEGKGRKALGNCAPNSVLLIAHMTMPYVSPPLGASPLYLQFREADNFTLAVYVTVCCILHVMIFNY